MSLNCLELRIYTFVIIAIWMQFWHTNTKILNVKNKWILMVTKTPYMPGEFLRQIDSMKKDCLRDIFVIFVHTELIYIYKIFVKKKLTVIY